MAGLVGTTALVLGMAAPSGAGTALAQTAGWTMEVDIPDYTWSKATGCEEVSFESAVISGRVLATSKAGSTGVPSGKVSIQRYVKGDWQQVDTAATAADGRFSTKVGGVTAAIPYRAVFAGTAKVNGSASPNVTPRLLPASTVKVTAKSGKSKLKVDVNPNKGKGSWTFAVQKKVGSTWVTQKSYKTEGSRGPGRSTCRREPTGFGSAPSTGTASRTRSRSPW